MLSYAEVFYEGARSQLLPTSIVLRAVWCYLLLREDRGRNRAGEGKREGAQIIPVLSRVSWTELNEAPTALAIWSEERYLIRSTHLPDLSAQLRSSILRNCKL